ncbi:MULTISPECIES: M50 family metallopeptidase [Streptomyces]|uniref:M50 family metallopeptidase n=2 Tax=Streptomyces TaxID=1883 RepID=UPI001038D55C|nr:MULTISPECIES: M50 family metallopeptidase [Streptomyces]MBT3074288.1 M50 family metallopeptidase [Streptomyces sp. COG21]MBT3083106.1 M50 family metallopeptidase [Streptomyces sp. COG20]MBT3085836.1 M50 family metallopeptidase [Streptomyces sp. CYG21]MBT3096085.1 M50 family metallopeptidase [Streptomyces sp. CBG30]MBT3105300.1 M50 family metallopeptidase [Streptomyces sp. COG19]
MSASGAVPGGSAGAAAGLAAYRPELRPRVLLSDPLLDGAATVHLIKDTGSGNSFKVGPKEHFLIARMDGERSLAEIGEEYAGEYGRRLGDAHWQQILTMLGTKGLLAGTPSQTAPVTPPEPRTLLRGTLPLVADADATTARLHRVFGFLLTPWAMGPLLVLLVAMEALVVAHSGDMLIAVRELFTNPVLLTGTAILLWVSTALHELAHGVVARHYGGRVAEIGLRWRLPTVIMYCTVDNYLYLGGRWPRIATAVAGAVMNLLFLLPFCALWILAPLDDATHEAISALLLLGSVQAFAMLVPLPPLDGYKIASQLAGATGLAASTGPYLRLALRRSPEAAAYPRRARIAYPAYALGTVLVLAALVAAAVAGVHHLLTA